MIMYVVLKRNLPVLHKKNYKQDKYIDKENIQVVVLINIATIAIQYVQSNMYPYNICV